jgi:hypothetical protein
MNDYPAAKSLGNQAGARQGTNSSPRAFEQIYAAIVAVAREGRQPNGGNGSDPDDR